LTGGERLAMTEDAGTTAEADASRQRWLLGSLAALVAVATGAAVAWWGGAVLAAGWGGTLVDTGWTPWLLPASRLLVDGSAVVTVGFLLAATFLVPGQVDSRPLLLSPAGATWVRAASWSAAVWAFGAAASLCFTMSDVLGVPVGQAVNLQGLTEVGFALDGGRVLIAVTVLAVAVAVACRYVRTVTAAAGVTALAVLTVLPPAFAGHSASSGNHQLAVSSLVIHIVAAVLWTGGLLALLLGRRRPAGELAASVQRFSQLAIWCYVLVGATGVTIALVRLWSLPGIVSTFGLLVGLKLAALVALGGFGWWHRRRSIPLLAGGARGVFTRIASIEALLMAATFGLAVALSRTPAPDGAEITGYQDSPLAPLLDGLPEPVFFGLALAAAGLYFGGVRRLREQGGSWPAVRTAAWIAGWVVVIFATDVQLAETTDFTLVETVQHLLIVAVAPLLLVAGAPLTLARDALCPATEPGMRGPREWLDVLLDGRAMQAAAHPVAAAALYAASLYGVYASVAHRWSLNSHASHLLVFGGALVFGGGYLWRTGLVSPPTRRAMRVVAALALLITVLAIMAPVRPPDLLVTAALLVPVIAMAAWSTLHVEPAPAPERARVTARI
jgi:putative copper resistance protein D